MERQWPSRPLILYEGRCLFCRWAAGGVARLDRKGFLAMLPFDDPRAEPYTRGLSDMDMWTSWHLIEPDGRDLVHGEALMALLHHLPVTRPLGRALTLLGMHRHVEAFDHWLGGSRSRLSRRLRRLGIDAVPPRRPPTGP